MSPPTAEGSSTDRDLWERAQGGDGDAFGTLFDRHIDRVYRHCAGILGSWSAAEDAASIVFLEAWRIRRRANLTSDSILPWFLAVATNVCRTLARSMARYRRVLSQLPATMAELSGDAEAIARVDAIVLQPRLRAAWLRLPRGEQQVFALAVVGQLSYPEISQILRIPLGTVKSRYSRARTRLRGFLAPEPGITGIRPVLKGALDE